MLKRPVARVLPESRLPQLDREFDFSVPDGIDIALGVRVKVPIGRGGTLHTGFVVDVADDTEYDGELSAIDQVVSPAQVLTPEMLASARQVARRQAGGLADFLRLAVPQRAVRVEKAWLSRESTTFQPPATPECPDGLRAADWEALTEPGRRIVWHFRYGVRDGVPAGYDDLLTVATSHFAEGRSAIVVVPDWRDIALCEQSLRQSVGDDDIVVFGPDLTPSETYARHLLCLEDRPRIVLGSRRAVYAPVSHLGLIAVVSDGDESLREQLAPYPHSRDVALVRAEQTGASVVLAGFSPSIEAVRYVDMEYFESVSSDRHTRPRVLPTSLSIRADDGPTPARLPSQAYSAATDALRNGPVLVQVFRAGFSPGLVCADCGERARCVECGGPLRRDSGSGPAGCGWCHHLTSRYQCPQCQSTRLLASGHGVGRTVHELGKAFPGVPVIQADGQHRIVTVPAKPALVVATRGAEPVAEGGYHAALLLDGQAMLQRASLDALEDTLAGWEWALALLRDGAQAFLTDLDGPVATSFASGASYPLLRTELQDRVSLRLPPAVRIAVLEGPRSVVDALVTDVCTRFADVDSLGTSRVEGTAVRNILRMPYKTAPAVAEELRAAVVRDALSGRRGARLRVKMDDARALDEFAEGAH